MVITGTKKIFIFIVAAFVCCSYSFSASSYMVSTGTGFFINKSGYIVTNDHVVSGCKSINVKGDGIEKTEAKFISSDKKLDLALLKIKKRPKHIAPMRYVSDFKPGDKVMILGYPKNHSVTRQYQVRTAKVVKNEGIYKLPGMIAFSDSITFGNSGGPLLDRNGNVIGVVTKMRQMISTSSGEILSKTDYAVDLSVLKNFLNKSYVSYDNLLTYNSIPYTNAYLENRAKKYTVSIHCIEN